MSMWPFAKKNNSRDVAVKRLQTLVRTNGESQAQRNEHTTSFRLEKTNDDEINSIVNYIKDYAFRNLSVERDNVKVHISRDGEGVTIVANIIYK
ncbi:MAG TPA: hypothetical protein PLS66_09460 [Tepiditoga sp.]|nr:hypothetical protein [Thermotogota bacterium]HOO75510.1 hypothetical protein [Tepiditoga sp.]